MHLYPIIVIFRYILFGDALNEPKSEVWMTVSSLADGKSQRNIELHWKSEIPKADDWIGLFTKDPTDGSGAIRMISIEEKSSGYYVTDVQFPYRNFPTGKLTEGCLGYYVALIRNGHVMAKNCIRNNPFWMEKSLYIIGHKPLSDIVIPGTHNAGCYEKYGPQSDGFLRRYQMTQDESIYNQLVYGIRYLDMRVGYEDISGRSEKYWIVHDVYRTDNSLASVAEQIKDFLNAAPNEIVIFDFHSFEDGFDEENDDIETIKLHYKEFFDIISQYLKEYMISFNVGYRVTVNQLIQSNKRVLIGYADKHKDFIESDLLWPKINHQWGNKDNVDDLEKYFESTLCSANKRILRSAMAELTPDLKGIIINKYGGLRKMAHDVNIRYTDWFRDRWWNCVNIIAADYFLGSNVIEIAINNNIRRIPKNWWWF